MLNIINVSKSMEILNINHKYNVLNIKENIKNLNVANVDTIEIVLNNKMITGVSLQNINRVIIRGGSVSHIKLDFMHEAFLFLNITGGMQAINIDELNSSLNIYNSNLLLTNIANGYMNFNDVENSNMLIKKSNIDFNEHKGLTVFKEQTKEK